MLRNARLATAVALVLFVPLAAHAELPPGFLGAWSGSASQTYPDGTIAEMPMSAAFLADGTGTTDYPDSPCSGILTPVPDAGPGVFLETITVNIDLCASGGTFTFTLGPDGLAFDWNHAKYGTASGVLARVGK